MPKFDALVIGSGLAGLHAAQRLVDDGLFIAMLDAGVEGAAALEAGAPLTFEEHRRYDPAQHRVFLGEDLSGIGATERDAGHAGTMTSGRREYVVRSAQRLLPTQSADALVTQSLAQGGLSEAWGGVCDFFDHDECAAVGIPADDMAKHYAVALARIGVSGAHAGFKLQPLAHLDDTHEEILEQYASRPSFAKDFGFSVRQPALALLTEDLGARKATAYRDMDFWDNIGRSVYRGHYALEELRTRPNFTYVPGVLVSEVAQRGAEVAVIATHLESGERKEFRAAAALMAAGALNTTRILLRSFGHFDHPVPVILKDNYLVPCLRWSRLGKPPRAARHSLCQLVMQDTRKKGGMPGTYVQLYSYASLLLHKLLRYVPLPVPEALSVLSLLVPSIVLADIRFPSTAAAERFCVLRQGSPDYMEVVYPDSPEERKESRAGAARAKRALRKLGLLPLATMRNQFGATSHYAGGIPYTAAPSEALGVNERGQLHQAKRIFVADAASWKALPGKPPGLTIAANADRVASHARNFLRSSN